MDHAGAALACITPDMSSCFAEGLADEINQQRVVRNICAYWFAIEFETYIYHACLRIKLSYAFVNSNDLTFLYNYSVLKSPPSKFIVSNLRSGLLEHAENI